MLVIARCEDIGVLHTDDLGEAWDNVIVAVCRRLM